MELFSTKKRKKLFKYTSRKKDPAKIVDCIDTFFDKNVSQNLCSNYEMFESSNTESSNNFFKTSLIEFQ